MIKNKEEPAKIKIKEIIIGGKLQKIPFYYPNENKVNLGDIHKKITEYEKTYKELLEKCTKIKKIAKKNKLNCYWEIGGLICRFKSNYNLKSLLKLLSEDLHISTSSLGRFVQFYKLKQPSLSKKDKQMSWSHYVEILRVPQDKREELQELVIKKKLNRNALRKIIDKLNAS